MKIKTSELQGQAFDWVVTTLEKPEACKYGIEDWREQRKYTVVNGEYVYRWHQSWAQGGPIIEREKIAAVYRAGEYWLSYTFDGAEFEGVGPTPLIAAMRCYVASKLGNEVEVPEDLQ